MSRVDVRLVVDIQMIAIVEFPDTLRHPDAILKNN